MKKNCFNKFELGLIEANEKVRALEKVNELYAEGHMDKYFEYEEEKRKLRPLNLTPEEYEYQIRRLCRRLGI